MQEQPRDPGGHADVTGSLVYLGEGFRNEEAANRGNRELFGWIIGFLVPSRRRSGRAAFSPPNLCRGRVANN